MISIITPAFNESPNLGPLHQRIVTAMETQRVDWEWVIVDDHSRDDTFAIVERLAAVDARVRGIRLGRNSGSHVAISCALHYVRGDAAVLLAADLQDPPELVPRMAERWRAGAQVVWAVRRERPGETYHRRFAALYYWIMRRLVGMDDMPVTGADVFLVDRVVIDALCRAKERNTSVFALVSWFGFRQDHVEYDKRPRALGRSGWTLAKKAKLVVDSITAFSDFPIRWIFYAGGMMFVAAAAAGVTGLALLPALGAAALLLVSVMLGLTAVQLCALAVVGLYVWRAMDAARGRPAYVVESDTRDRMTVHQQ
jgi:polyisoprenyl-phosphate glycosyltransferase